LLWSERFMPV